MVYRRIELYDNQATLPNGWHGIKRLVKVRRWGLRNNAAFDEQSYFILSKPINSAQTVAYAIQNHWSIENNLHWVKDVIIKEDSMTLKDKNTVSIVVYMNNAALNLIRCAGYKPVKDTFAKLANKVHELHKLFKT